MDVKEKSRFEIEQRLQKMGDYVQMDYLNDCLKKQLDFDSRKFVLVRLAKLYEAKHMFNDAARLMRAAADINTTARNKIDDFVKAAELFIKAGNYDDADLIFNRAMAEANTLEKVEIKNKRKEFYKIQARTFLQNEKRAHALRVYEKILTLELDSAEKSEVREKLLDLYLKLGKVREYGVLKRS